MILRGCIFLLIFVGVFDPADRLLGLKVPAFILCWLVFLIYFGLKPLKIMRGVYVYIFLMLFIPVLSMFYFEVFLGGGQTAALMLIKAHLFASLIYILVATKIDIIPMVCRILCLLSLVIISVKFVVIIFPELAPAIRIFGSTYGILLLGHRTYANSVGFDQIYFVASPMLVIAVAYYSDRACKSVFFSWNSFFACASIVGMVLAGTRSNMIAPFLTLGIVLFLNSRNKVLLIAVLISTLILFTSFFYSTISEVLSLNEDSNASKLKLLQDYGDIFNDPVNLIFGQGFGSYYHWQIRGDYFITELSYLELIRVYGLIFGTIMAGLVLYPILFVMASKCEFPSRASITGFTVYMAIAALNPLIFSSLGMTIISAFVANVFRAREFYPVYQSTELSYNKSLGLD